MDGETKGQLALIITIIIIATPIALYKEYKTRKTDRKWTKKTFFFGTELSRDTLMEAHICLAARMIQSDMDDAGKKVIYIDKYLRKVYHNRDYKFKEVLTQCYKNPIDERTVALWLNLQVRDRSKKMQVMYFLAGLAHVDGSINGREMKMLHSINKLLDLTPKEFQTVIGMYQQRYQRKQAPKSYTKKSAKKLACKILGVAESASADEIKKAYRKLVKIHHPDKFSNESIEQQELAEERFIEVQKAYEALES